MNPVRKCGIAFVLLLAAMLVVLVPSAGAVGGSSSALTELEDRLAEAVRQREKAEQDVAEAQSDKENAQRQKSAIDKKILSLIGEMDAIGQLIDGYELSIADKNNEIADKEALLERQYEILRQRLRLNHESGGLDIVAILLETDGLTDFFAHMDRFTCMMEYDKRMMKSYTEGIDELNVAKTALTEQKNALEDARLKLEERQAQLELDRAEADRLIAKAEADVSAAQATLEEVEKLERQYNAEREAMLAERQSQSNQSYVGGKFLWPLPQTYTTVSCGFGWRTHPVTGQPQFHRGIDIPAAYGTEIYACNNGTVVEVSYNYADGYYVTIDHGGGVASFYSHLSRYRVKVGDKVERGQVIANVGTSGYTTGAHLNLNIYEDSTAVNPLTYFQK